MNAGKSESLSEQVFRELEEAILNGEYQPGQSLPELRLCEKYRVSRTPVREALSRLEQEGLVSIVPNRGTLVTGISPKDMRDIYDIRLRVEGLAARWSAQNITADQLDAMRQIVDLQEFYTLQGDLDQVRAMDTQFHRALYSDCGSPSLKGVLTDLHHKIKYFRRSSLMETGRAAKSMQEHRAIYEALAARDGTLAEELTIAHIRHARENLEALHQKEQARRKGIQPS